MGSKYTIFYKCAYTVYKFGDSDILYYACYYKGYQDTT